MCLHSRSEVQCALKLAVEAYPSWRLGQIIDNAMADDFAATGMQRDLFYVDDERLARALFALVCTKETS